MKIYGKISIRSFAVWLGVASVSFAQEAANPSPTDAALEAKLPVAAVGENVEALKDKALDARLVELLKTNDFNPDVESSLTQRLGRPINRDLAKLGMLLFSDAGLGRRSDNSCAGCHSPTHSWGDTQPIAIGILNGEPIKDVANFVPVVGVNRTGPRNQRRTPSVVNNAFYPKLMWNGRFAVKPDPNDPEKPELGDPFDNRFGFSFPAPEGANAPVGLGLFPAGDRELYHLLVPQAHIPFTELPEMAGFRGAAGDGDEGGALGFFTSSRFQTKVRLPQSPQQQVLRARQFIIRPKEAPAQPDASSRSPEAFEALSRSMQMVKPMNRAKVKSAGVDVGDHGQGDFAFFDDHFGSTLPDNDFTGTRNEPIRQSVLEVINHEPKPSDMKPKTKPDGTVVPPAWEPGKMGPKNPPRASKYRELFRPLFPHLKEHLAQDQDANPSGSQDPDDITMRMVTQAIAEFEFTLTFANAPLDKFARDPRHDPKAMTDDQKRGAVLFFGKARCVECHAVGGRSNAMFSDFQSRVIGVPQVAPRFGKNPTTGKLTGDVLFRDLLGEFNEEEGNQDFGLEDLTDDIGDRYKFRTAPLRNLKFQRAFFHNGSFKSIRGAIAHHLDVETSLANYKAANQMPPDLQDPKFIGPKEPVLARLDSKLKKPMPLTKKELDLLTIFVADGLFDDRADPRKFDVETQLPKVMPTGVPRADFKFTNLDASGLPPR